MLVGQKILITGAQGRVAFPIARALAESNDVYGLARFTNELDQHRLRSVGIKCIKKDLRCDPVDDLANDFDYVLHAAVFHGAPPLGVHAQDTWNHAFDVNVFATGRLMYHCHRTKGFFYFSSGWVYQYQSGHRALKEGDALAHRWIDNPVYTITKIAAEQMVKFISQQCNIPATIARLVGAYGPTGGSMAVRLGMILEGREIPLNEAKPNFFNPIYEDDYVELAIKGMTLAQVPPLVTNWAGSELITIEECCEYMGWLVGKDPIFQYTSRQFPGIVEDVTFMHQVLGKTQVHWKDGIRRMVEALHPELILPHPN